MKPEWYVMLVDRDEMVPYNVFRSLKFCQAIESAVKQPHVEDFVKAIDVGARYAFSYKAEYELLVSDLFRADKSVKIDVYKQLKLNWKPFVRYCLETFYLED